MTETTPRAWRPMRAVLAVLILGFLAAGGYAGWVWLQSRDNKAAASTPAAAVPVPVQAAAAGRADVPIYLTGLGNVQAYNTVTVRSRVDGEIQKIAFEEGQMVKQGDLLLQIDPRPFQAALDQAVAKKAQDEAQLVSAKADLERTTNLLARNYATHQLYDSQQAGVNALMAQIRGDQGAIDNAKTQLEYTTIRAPLSGRTGFRQVDQGNIIHAADTNGVVEITQIEPISVVFTVPESQLPTIVTHQKLGPLKVWALPPSGKEILGEGVLTLLNNQVDTGTGTIRLKARFDNKEHTLWPGQSVNARLLVQTLKGVVTVPNTAVQRGPNGLFVYLVKPDKTVEMRSVGVGPITEDKAVIESGLQPGDEVVTAGQYRLQPGATVDITNAQENNRHENPQRMTAQEPS
ncbi:efflux RND transporter periplasmic adaptor subunit [Microvirga terricola]|uniref:Efflux RND transporter periplasmic adaptor subunit n=1 Tax=Microvirga terricola TaxID=2719797 RepID=A0ABX0V9N5_9HYPH|nr:efflux RND transporter periplasmic adaptor subunit [Microvirga terricola]NIX76553.1 efflux RND transporter periplasmic adaptor subunit [Microvirga terricola]